MLDKRVAQRNKIFEEIKEMYEDKIITFDMSSEKLLSYQSTYIKIITLLEALNADNFEIRVRLGEDFERWLYDTHPKLISQFWDELKG